MDLVVCFSNYELIINIMINMDEGRQERPKESPILKLNKRLK